MVGGQKGVCVVWGAVALYGGTVQESYAAEDRLCLPLHEEMRQALTQRGTIGAGKDEFDQSATLGLHFKYICMQ